MSSCVIDTHALFWHLSNHQALSRAAQAAILAAESGTGAIFVPAIVLAELYYLNRKLPNPLNFKAKFLELQTSSHFQLMPLESEDTLQLDAPQFGAVSEMHDRLIVIAAHRLGLPLITKDANIVAAKAVPIIW
jgi:PIN domain nuclease of toxin-antitoxin system